MPQSTRRRSRDKFPLSLHATGQYRKKIRGRDYYFGVDRDAALKEYVRVKEDLEAGRRPRSFEGDVTLKDLCNHFCTHKRHQSETGEIAPRTFTDYHKSCERMLSFFGNAASVEQMSPDDLLGYRRKLGQTLGAVALGNEVVRVRTILKHAFDNCLIDKPVRCGSFRKPTKKAVRLERNAAEAKLFSAAEIRKLLDTADEPLRTMIVLALNAGFGNADIGRLPIAAIDFDTGWIDFPRPKTGVGRRCLLWPETAAVLKAAIANRPNPAVSQHRGLVFITERGRPWHSEDKPSHSVSNKFRKLVKASGIHRRGVGFYALRHTFQTIGDELGDYLATRTIMGHASEDIGAHYRERFPDDRLVRVTDHVRCWLFGGHDE